MTAALATNNLFDNRGYWRGAVETARTLPPPPAAQTPFEVASADPAPPAAPRMAALAYARAGAKRRRPRPPRPMGSAMPRLPLTATLTPASSGTAVLVKPPLTAAKSQLAGTLADPWLRAAMLTPSVNHFMTATILVAADPRPLHELMSSRRSRW